MPNQINQKRLLITHSLLNAWNYIYKASDDWRDSAYDSFMQVLNRLKTEPTQAMLNGRAFETLVSDVVAGKSVDCAHKWIDGATAIADIIGRTGHWEQGKMMKEVAVNGVGYLLYGVPDWFGGGFIYDVKFKENIGNYEVGHYFDGTQHRLYFELIYGADEFMYLVSNGKKVYRETYKRQECRPISETIIEFENWLKCYDLWHIYVEKWQTQY